MNCKQSRDLIGASLYDDLDPGIEQSFHTHLSRCQDCRQERDQLQQARSALDAVEVPAVQLDPFRTPPRPLQAPTKRTLRSAGWRAAAALVVALAGIGTLALTDSKLEVGDGTLRVSFSLPGADQPPTPAPVGLSPASVLEDVQVGLRQVGQRIQALELRHEEDLVTLARVVDRARGQVHGELRQEVEQLRNRTERALFQARGDLRRVVHLISATTPPQH